VALNLAGEKSTQKMFQLFNTVHFVISHLSLTSIELSGNIFNDDGVDTVFKGAPHALKHVGLVGIELASFLEHGLCNFESLTFTVPDDCHGGIGRT